MKTPAISLQGDNKDIYTNPHSLICNKIFVDLLRYTNYLHLDGGGTQHFYRSPGHQVEPLCQLCQLYVKTLLTTFFQVFLFSACILVKSSEAQKNLHIFFLRKYYRYSSSDPELTFPTFIWLAISNNSQSSWTRRTTTEPLLVVSRIQRAIWSIQ